MNKLIFYLFLSFSMQAICQESNFYILDEDGYLNTDEHSKIHYLFKVKRNDNIFGMDTYIFLVPNRVGFDEFLTSKELRKSIDLNSVNYVETKELSKMGSCDLHEFFSKKKFTDTKLNVIFKTGNRYFTYRIDYKGTAKNLNSFK